MSKQQKLTQIFPVMASGSNRSEEAPPEAPTSTFSNPTLPQESMNPPKQMDTSLLEDGQEERTTKEKRFVLI